MNSSPTNFPNF